MTRTLRVLAALAIICVAAPALAHGGHNGGHDSSHDNSTQHMQSSQKTTTPSQVVNPKFNPKSIVVNHELGALANRLFADVQAGNKAGLRRLVREIRQNVRLLGKIEGNPNLTLTLVMGDNHYVVLSTGGVTIDGKPV